MGITDRDFSTFYHLAEVVSKSDIGHGG